MDYQIGLLGNFVIKGTIEAKTGLHIGAAAETVEIGGIDSPVIKHPKTGAPYIPGSSLKGKMRSFLERVTYAEENDFRYNRVAHGIRQHVCDDLHNSYIDKSANKKEGTGALDCPVCRVFGSTGQNDGQNHPSRIVVRDCHLINEKNIMEDNLYIFEAKMENAIDRMTAAAHPRTFERVPAGAEFEFEIVYKVQGEIEERSPGKLKQEDLQRTQKDIQNIFEVLSLIEKDGLGGNVSRGYGRVNFVFKKYECKYYQVGGEVMDFLPSVEAKDGDLLEALRKNDFSHLKNLINGDDV